MGSIQPSISGSSTIVAIFIWEWERVYVVKKHNFWVFKMYLTWGVWISHLYSSWSNKAVPALPLPFALNSFVTVRGSSRGIDTVISISFGIGQDVVIVGQTRISIIEWKKLKIEWFYVMYNKSAVLKFHKIDTIPTMPKISFWITPILFWTSNNRES